MPPRKRKAESEAEDEGSKEKRPSKKASGAGRAPAASRPKRGAAATGSAATNKADASKRKKPAAAAGDAAKKKKKVATKITKKKKEEPAVLFEGGNCFTFGTNPFGALGMGEDVTEKPRAGLVELRVQPGKRGAAASTASTSASGGAPAPVVQVVAGGMHTAALSADGTVFTWGVNDEGALGRPTAGSAWEDHKAGDKEDPALPGPARLPRDAPKVVQLAAGDGFTFALGDDGSVWGWGCFKDDGSGAAGFPGAPKSAKGVQRLPAKVYAPASTSSRATRIAAGARHMAALTASGDVLTWGMGGQGQLGRVEPFNNDSFPELDLLLKPARVPGLTSALGGAAADVACGAYSTFAISKRGAVAAWGLNNAGQLALPLAAEAAAAAAAAGGKQQQRQRSSDDGGKRKQQQQDGEEDGEDEEGHGHFHWRPKFVDALRRVAAIAGGEHHSLALTRRGEVLSFGAPTYGMLGRSNVDAGESSSANHAPSPVDLADGLGDEAVVGVAAGTNVSAAVTRGGNAYFWGSNVNYQMAKGADDDDNELPTRMRRHKAFGQRRVLAVAFGGQHGAILASGEPAEEGA